MVENYNSRIRTAINDFRGLSQSMADLLRLYQQQTGHPLRCEGQDWHFTPGKTQRRPEKLP